MYNSSEETNESSLPWSQRHSASLIKCLSAALSVWEKAAVSESRVDALAHSESAQKMRISLAVRGLDSGTIDSSVMDASSSPINRFAIASSRCSLSVCSEPTCHVTPCHVCQEAACVGVCTRHHHFTRVGQQRVQEGIMPRAWGRQRVKCEVTHHESVVYRFIASA